jgi:hypothetical protein
MNFALDIVPNYEDVPFRINYGTRVASEPSSRYFVPLDGFDDAALDRISRERVWMGCVGYDIYPGKHNFGDRLFPDGVLGLPYFFPFGNHYEGLGSLKRIFLGKGIADRIELFVSDDLLDFFGEGFGIWHPTRSISGLEMTPGRKQQLARLGVETDVWYDLREHADIVRTRIEAAAEKGL